MVLNHLLYLAIILLSYDLTLTQHVSNPLAGKVICVDAGHGGTSETDSYRVGPSGEREEWINLRVAFLLRDMLEKRGAEVIMTRTEDVNISLDKRARLANEQQADVFISIHHNATADPTVNFPIIYFHGNASENKAGVALGKYLAEKLAQHLYEGEAPASLVSDHTIFPTAGTRVLRKTYGIPGVLAEASFFTNPAEEKRLKQRAYNRREAMAYVEALEGYFGNPQPRVLEKHSVSDPVPKFDVFQEAERMNKIALNWHNDFLNGQKLMQQTDTASQQQAYKLFTRSARSFPDSYVAAEAHRNRAILLNQLGKYKKAKQAERRAREFYVGIFEE